MTLLLFLLSSADAMINDAFIFYIVWMRNLFDSGGFIVLSTAIIRFLTFILKEIFTMTDNIFENIITFEEPSNEFHVLTDEELLLLLDQWPDSDITVFDDLPDWDCNDDCLMPEWDCDYDDLPFTEGDEGDDDCLMPEWDDEEDDADNYTYFCIDPKTNTWRIL